MCNTLLIFPVNVRAGRCTITYACIPVPAGISFPIITFSFNPIRESTFPFIAASVSTLVVSWNDAADKKLSVASDAFVIPSKALVPVAGLFPSAITFSFSSLNSLNSLSLVLKKIPVI